MSMSERTDSSGDADRLGIPGASNVHWNASSAELTEEAVKRGDAQLSEHGAIVADTGKYTGRSPNDKFFAKEPDSEALIWWGDVNKPFGGDVAALEERVRAHLGTKELHVQELYAGAAADHRPEGH